MRAINYNRLALILGAGMVVLSFTVLADGDHHLFCKCMGGIFAFGGITKSFWT
tara:strand:- start:168 stop:326 length:159 start_codon:yes stop_codon:yes gene_type:complete